MCRRGRWVMGIGCTALVVVFVGVGVDTRCSGSELVVLLVLSRTVVAVGVGRGGSYCW